MYHLTLTVEQQNAIDWVGHRYFGGNDLKKILLSCDLHEDCDGTPWGENDLTFLIPEHKAWEIRKDMKMKEKHGLVSPLNSSLSSTNFSWPSSNRYRLSQCKRMVLLHWDFLFEE